MSYADAAAYGNDAVWLKLGAPHSEKPRVGFEAGSLELGNHELAAGQHHLRFTVAGKNAASTGHLFGVDAIDLLDE